MAEAKLTLNAVGWECPKPVIETKRLLDTIKAGQVLTLTDDSIVRDNLLDFAASHGYSSHCAEEAGTFHVCIRKTPEQGGQAATKGSEIVILITDDALGHGAEDFGQTLMKSYLFALSEAEQQPQTLIFMNRGVFLACEDSPALESLHNLAAAGVEILACGACLDFYGLTTALAVGKISNMYNIVNRMNKAGNTIKL